MKFFNSMKRKLSFADVIACIKYFIRANPDCEYRIEIGTDSQVKGRYICFVTGIRIYRMGGGSWYCICRHVEINKCETLEDRVSRENSITYEMANLLNESISEALWDFSVKYKNFNCRIEAIIDAGANDDTRKLIREITGYIGKGRDGMEAKIKSGAFAASAYAGSFNKDTEAG